MSATLPAPGADTHTVGAGSTVGQRAHLGRITVKERVLIRVTEEATSRSLHIDRNDVKTTVSETRGGIGISISVPLPVPDLDNIDAVREGAPVLERAASLQAHLKDQVGHIVGRKVTWVNITVTGAQISTQKRVR